MGHHHHCPSRAPPLQPAPLHLPRHGHSRRDGAPDGAAAWIEEHLGLRVTGTKFQGGSSWSSAYVYDTEGGRRLFVKTALGRDPEAMFRGEAEGLRAMHGGRAGQARSSRGRKLGARVCTAECMLCRRQPLRQGAAGGRGGG